MNYEIEKIGIYRQKLQDSLNTLVQSIGELPIGVEGQFPFGWRKAAKGRTVWRLLEEVISQNLELKAESLGLIDFSPAESEVGVYDFSFRFQNTELIYVNIKSAVQGRIASKDDISKGDKLLEFLNSNSDIPLFIATIEINFLENPLRVALTKCYVLPTTWLPDVYVNPSNNGNLQSSKYKDLEAAIKRTKAEFIKELELQIDIAQNKKKKKIKV